MKIMQFHLRIMKIIEILEFHKRITNITKILGLQARLKNLGKSKKFCENFYSSKAQTFILAMYFINCRGDLMTTLLVSIRQNAYFISSTIFYLIDEL